MANPFYQQMVSNGMMPVAPNTMPAMGKPINPIVIMQAMMNAMQNPVGFVAQAFPDIPNEIRNDPGRILGYLQQTRGISNNAVQQTFGQMSSQIGQMQGFMGR